MPLLKKQTPSYTQHPLQKKMGAGKNSTASFEDRRPDSIAQRKMVDLIDNNPQLASRSQSDYPVQTKTGNSMPLQQKADLAPRGTIDHVLQKASAVMNHDFSDVNIIQNSSEASRIGALAFTQGNDIHVAQGMFDPSSSTGQQLLGHELAHVVQQSKGLVKPTGEIGGYALNDSLHFEKEADSLGQRVANFSF
ncbi:MAG: DUF4157 domain-containing protein [Cytophagales bacterium]|nr:DUF4157 domain-containing protein [Cytophagales bacterium]